MRRTIRRLGSSCRTLAAGTLFIRRRFPEERRQQCPQTKPHRTDTALAAKPAPQLETRVESEECWTRRDKTTGQFMDQKVEEEKSTSLRKDRRGRMYPSS